MKRTLRDNLLDEIGRLLNESAKAEMNRIRSAELGDYLKAETFKVIRETLHKVIDNLQAIL